MSVIGEIELVLRVIDELDINTNLSPNAIYENTSSHKYYEFGIWCVPEDKPIGWARVDMSKIEPPFIKPCRFVAAVEWNKKGTLSLETTAYALQELGLKEKDCVNRPEDIAWAKDKIYILFALARVAWPRIVIG